MGADFLDVIPFGTPDGVNFYEFYVDANGYQRVKITDGTSVAEIQAVLADNENLANALTVASALYAFDGANWDRLRTIAAGGTTSALLVGITDGADIVTINPLNQENISVSDYALNVKSFLHIYDPTGNNWDRLRGQSAYANIDDTSGVLSVAGVVHGEDLEAGAGNSEPAKVRTDDDSLPAAEKHLVVISLNYVWSIGSSAWVRMTQP